MNLDFFVRTSTLDPVANSHIKTLSTTRRLLLYPIWLIARMWSRTWRFEVTSEARAALSDTSVPTVLLFWHNRLFLTGEVYHRYRRPRLAYGLVSASNDGAWLAAFLELSGLGAVRGSSSRRGREALFELATLLSEGNDLAITPDGPRGPIYSFKPGAALLVRRTQARVLLIGTNPSASWRLNSWDRFMVPGPFSTVEVTSRLISASDLPSDREECVEALRSALIEMNAD